MFGRERKPTPLITALACQTRGPSGPTASISQTLASSSQITDFTSVLNSIFSRIPNLSVTQLKYCSFSFCSQNGFGYSKSTPKMCVYVRLGESTARARVAVLEPGAADPGVLLDHDVGHAGLLELYGGAQTAGPGADHHDGEFLQSFRLRLLPPGEPSRPRVEGQLLQPHLQLGCGDVLAAGEAEAPGQLGRLARRAGRRHRRPGRTSGSRPPWTGASPRPRRSTSTIASTRPSTRPFTAVAATVSSPVNWYSRPRRTMGSANLTASSIVSSVASSSSCRSVIRSPLGCERL